MLGSAVYTVLTRSKGFTVYGTVRSAESMELFPKALRNGLVEVSDLEDLSSVDALIDKYGPEIIINCLSVKKAAYVDVERFIKLYAILPKRLSMVCAKRNIRLIQIGTDGVFSGKRGKYTESDVPDASDTYGMAKFLGEISEPHAITLRTSIIGPELRDGKGLLHWFLSQEGRCNAYSRVVFSGLPTNVLAEVIRDAILPRPKLHGIYHIAAPAISKMNLLKLIAERYEKNIELVNNESPESNLALDATRFADATGYSAPDWESLVDSMYTFHRSITRA